ncbi:CPBP family intramembrane glutamic endopeptidase [Glutamicibacter halophytocola]|uniref:CPBP family intramembrane glutamic endopeptidase n=1 Tax=Glutamicibacter halophytocola TaxID=1933880 RepID=UPI00321BAA51
MRRNHDYRWWRPLAFAGTGLGFFVALFIVVMLIIFVVALVNPANWAADPNGAPDSLLTEADLDMTSPIDFTITMASLIIMIPAVYLAYLLLGSKPVGQLISVAGRLRWRWFAMALGTSSLLFAAYFALSFGLTAAGVGGQPDMAAVQGPADPLFFALLVILLTPFQCAAEELVFRGALMQIIGSWLKHPLFAILLPVPLFTFGHLYDVYGLLDVTAFAIAAGYLTWRTGGLEAAMAMHIINNTFLFLLGAMGQVDLNATSSGPMSLLFSVLFTAAADICPGQAVQQERRRPHRRANPAHDPAAATAALADGPAGASPAPGLLGATDGSVRTAGPIALPAGLSSVSRVPVDASR